MGERMQFTELDQYLFGQATHYDLYKKLGAHPVSYGRQKGVYFAVWAPNAQYVSVIGEFNDWDTQANPMEKAGPIGVFQVFVPGAREGQLYKFYIVGMHGEELYKADPYANAAEMRPGTASRITDISSYKWNDGVWMKNRPRFNEKKDAMAIYEVHPGSWMKHPSTEDNREGFFNYREFGEMLAKYVKEMGYTHVELMGIAEHPFDGSWGYQVTGYYAPTSRYGTPQDFKYMVDYLHRQKIGVILDWVPAHFPKDAHGLANFDGTAVYEHEDPRQGEHPDWGTKIYNYGRPEVKNFLIANALFWIEECHVDGLRVDAVASMLYLDYGKSDGQWVANKYGGNENLEAIEFFKHLNTVVLGRNHGTVMIAEESTAWPKVTGKAEDGGLGFSLKWNMGWMNDFLEYMKLDPYFRKDNHNKMTFAITYAYSEKYVLVLSHDEVVHLKCSMLSKMPGELEDKFKNLKAGYTFMMGHPGKKLLFMGQDFGQLREWSEERELDWFLLQEKEHRDLQSFVKDLLYIYRKYPAVHATDNDPQGFEWINADDAYRSIFSFVRKSPTKRNNLLFICNFTPVARPDYRVGVPRLKQYTQLMDENGRTGKKVFRAVKQECDNRPYSFAYPLPAYGIAIFQY
ncbi:1,4-alpha-glucan branching protein GlgB [Blautia ammoniilytica]|uniref:1,4-alpha-glucan branching enzyme GlgB n=1 Tax=Blautia ammoniilytica TaxID=2981782 RepID=A0ABT2TR39_9FIRM|nr:1,4-alpha-glucan branching protein GlgB [Blautia ammoniilytica]MCU6764683.1 1,4-alpha-glucan branching protein GlgB [Blautia ammoniilytica]SCH54404.1 1%2C4-alpha-glucan branching enzyme GlgB [uncultured Blautia sp.]